MKWGWKYKICLYKPFCQIFPGAGIVETDMRVGQCRGAVRVKKLIHIFYSNIPTSLANFIFFCRQAPGAEVKKTKSILASTLHHPFSSL